MVENSLKFCTIHQMAARGETSRQTLTTYFPPSTASFSGTSGRSMHNGILPTELTLRSSLLFSTDRRAEATRKMNGRTSLRTIRSLAKVADELCSRDVRTCKNNRADSIVFDIRNRFDNNYKKNVRTEHWTYECWIIVVTNYHIECRHSV